MAQECAFDEGGDVCLFVGGELVDGFELDSLPESVCRPFLSEVRLARYTYDRAINRGQGHSGITRIDSPKISHEKRHAIFEDGSALNVDGTSKRGSLDLTRDQSSWLVENGWKSSLR